MSNSVKYYFVYP